jgi:mRNA-degrading endonuclease RelE of RelBE toxin-antitoxin system
MKSATLPSFWKAYRSLDRQIRGRARKAFRLWAENPFHPSLHFKCINTEEGIWSVRVTLGYRALGVLESDTVTWFWIGSHDDYERFFSS